MIISKISLTNFRNQSSYELDCKKDTTLILGPNGYGKTSVLEAIYILTRGKSFRASDPDIKNRTSEFYRIELTTDSGEKRIATFDGNTKTFIISDKKFHRLPKAEKYPVILFLPSDLNLIGGSPSRHREYFDRFFSQISEEYNTSLSKYEKALKQRNEILKNENLSPASLFSWNILLAKYGTIIHRIREELVNRINQELSNVYYSIADKKDNILLSYKSDVKSNSENQYLNTLEANLNKDIILGHTSFGVHRDDFDFIFNDKIADGSASRGEGRTVILALKFIEANMITNLLNEKPIILLDDVFSELDETRRRFLVKNFKDNQIILTSVENIKLDY